MTQTQHTPEVYRCTNGMIFAGNDFIAVLSLSSIAKAAFIVRACNSFDSLVQELGDAIQLLEALGEDTIEFKKALDF